MKRGEIYRTHDRVPERGHKPGFYVIISRDFVSGNDDIATVVCAPIYSEILGLRSEVTIGTDEGLPRASAIRCDFIMLMFKTKLTHFAGSMSRAKIEEMNQALRYALDI